MKEQIPTTQKKSECIIYSAEEESEVDVSEYDPLSFFFLLIFSVIFIKTLPPYHTLPSIYRKKRILPPKREGTPEYTLVDTTHLYHV